MSDKRAGVITRLTRARDGVKNVEHQLSLEKLYCSTQNEDLGYSGVSDVVMAEIDFINLSMHM